MRWGHKIDHFFVGRHKCMTPNATRIRQSLSLLVSLDTCYYLSLEKLNWVSFWLILHVTKSGSTLRIGRSGNSMVS